MFAYLCLSGAKNKQIQVVQLVTDSLDVIDLQIGDDGVDVEIVETKISKNKHYMRNLLNGVLRHGSVERTEERRLFLVVPNRRGDVIGPNSHSCTPRIYITNRLFKILYPETGVYTNSVEGTWNGLIYQIPSRNRTNPLDDNDKVIENVLNDHLGKFE
ncbi:hypothetical protein RF11_12509 [Thelohanellus kitauei]|uniref:Uncharacterized protein n=1 Tax=Thelohanellus kitauei TaxID=669202 RepID=A0A0C2NGR9_THEKT|nr:hypothetical protein RF11_12509 [Thelohanellus kitauei]